jgi:hypothetical protein
VVSGAVQTQAAADESQRVFPARGVPDAAGMQAVYPAERCAGAVPECEPGAQVAAAQMAEISVDPVTSQADAVTCCPVHQAQAGEPVAAGRADRSFAGREAHPPALASVPGVSDGSAAASVQAESTGLPEQMADYRLYVIRRCGG